MRIEYIPILAGVVVLLLGAAIMWDAWEPQSVGPMRDRRRRARAGIDTRGEFIAGLGIALLGAALVGRDWRFETLTVLVGTIFVVAGAFRNQRYFRETFLFRGAARRGDPAATNSEDKPATRNRIR